ncbi:MAG: hypothetical protein IKA23_09465 [Akkermansia sp.]|nr:hypothetical protein [Akkermansia sp.]
MKFLFCTCAAALASLLVSCSSSPEMEAVAARVQKTRIDNALYAKAARIRVWKDTSKQSKDGHGWCIHSEQEHKYTLPENEFKTARYLLITHGYTAWSKRKASILEVFPRYVVELEWIGANGRTTGGVDLTRLKRESQYNGLDISDFPFILHDKAYEQFFALPTVSRALDVVKE